MSGGPAEAEWTPPEDFEEYRLIRELGRGTMGRVYLAHDMLLDRLVAVKFIGGAEPHPGMRERFFTEARAIARLQHPNVVAIYRVGEVKGRPFLVSEFVRGQRLEALKRPLPWRRVLELGLAIARGLAAAHRVAVLHRDVKPANVMLAEDGEVKLLDFGLAELLEPGSRHRAPQRPVRRQPPGGGVDPLETTELPATGAAAAAPASAATVPARDPASSGGQALGTPRYMAPELWQGAPASRQSDVYALGTVLHELCTGRAPNQDLSVEALPEVAAWPAAVPVRQLAPEVDARLAELIDACLARDPAARPASGEAVRRALQRLVVEPRSEELPDGNPFRGLLSFEAEHRPFFFGRSAEIHAVVERLRSERVVVVAGDSGVGKSSLCRAGVLPALADGALGEKPSSGIVQLIAGRTPLDSLTAALAPMLGEDAVVVGAALRTEPAALVRALGRRSRILTSVLFLDQLEELWTIAPEGQGAAILRFIAAVAEHGTSVRVLATVRSDFLSRLATVSGSAGDELGRALYLLRPITAESVRELVTGPVEMKGFRFESDAMVTRLERSALASHGALPLLQFALAELWDARDEARQIIPESALERIGGVEGALARHADAVIASLAPAQRPAAQRMLTELVSAEGTRTRRTRSQLAREEPAARAALETLVRGRLLVTCEGDATEATYEIAHEALLQGWDTLRGWLGRDAEKRALRQRVERAAAEWERLGAGLEGLWTQKQLDELGDVEHRPGEYGAREASFLVRSGRAARQRRWRRRVVTAALPVALVVGLGAMWLRHQVQLDRAVRVQLVEAQQAQGSAATLEAQLEGRRAEALKLFEGQETDRAETLWTEARDLEARIDALHWGEGRNLETAHLLAPARRDLLERMAAFTFRRALFAERAGRPSQRAELLERLAAYDLEGAFLSRLGELATLTIDLVAPGASSRLFGCSEDGCEPFGEDELAAGPVQLPPGSWLLEAQAPGRVVVRHPLLLTRGEQLSVRIDPPSTDAVPDGFVYIPEGRFLAGTHDPEEVRRGFFRAPPLHQRHTAAYLIARHEVTFGQWFEFLRALPPEERRLRLPRAGSTAMPLFVKELEDGAFELHLTPTRHTYVAREGEPIHYLERALRASQDWRRFPVSGITVEDARAYARWSAQSGRVPGARLCTGLEWERAARGADGRPFPGGQRLGPDDANIDVTYGRVPLSFGPDEVGSHPKGRSPFGVDDLAGNVWEFTERSAEDASPIIRGGSWYQGELSARSVNREPVEPSFRNALVGVRLCASAH
jgi:eukaryotic-like serine/threonine-protein kinase